MGRKIVISKGNKTGVFSSLAKVCKKHPNFKASTLYNYDFPFEHQGWRFERKEENEKASEKNN